MLDSLYHALKPVVPRTLQIAMRRSWIKARRNKFADVWPILESAGKPPDGWTGWPEGKKFALILTHDVETEIGVERSHKLANLDRTLGFRSSFNFVPESCTSAGILRSDLVADGFEVGVHGLCHDGNLYASRRKFVKMASKIDAYLKDWRAVGFRTPSMYHNLDWVGELDIEYDSSTFDTDPFEPQPDGAGTIFPFQFQGGPTSKSIIELPYTLPQDFTLFVLMKEKNIDVWKKKLDWIAEKGGMALLITHPDYMAMEPNKPELGEYPMAHYMAFLDYVKSQYSGQYWNVLPKEVTRFWASLDRMRG